MDTRRSWRRAGTSDRARASRMLRTAPSAPASLWIAWLLLSLDDSSLFDPVEPVDVFPKTLALQAFHELRHGIMLSVVRRVEKKVLAAAPRAGPHKLVLRLSPLFHRLLSLLPCETRNRCRLILDAAISHLPSRRESL